MSFKKLNIALQNVLEEEELSILLPFQEFILPKIKSGADCFINAPKGSGKTVSIVIALVQRLLTSKTSNAPRALVLVKEKKDALELEQLINDIVLMMDLDVFSVFDSQQIYNQKDTMYYGVDIVVATPQRLLNLYTQCGISLNELKMFIIEDAELLINNQYFSEIERIGERLGKCQRIVVSNKYIPRFEDLKTIFMDRAQEINWLPEEISE